MDTRAIRSLGALGQLLRDGRRRHGLTQRQLADRSGATQTTISNIERGSGDLRFGTLLRLLSSLGLELAIQPVEGLGQAHPWEP
jgi:transcriptional regulator with XRE-family HTH domain